MKYPKGIKVIYGDTINSQRYTVVLFKRFFDIIRIPVIHRKKDLPVIIIENNEITDVGKTEMDYFPSTYMINPNYVLIKLDYNEVPYNVRLLLAKKFNI